MKALQLRSPINVSYLNSGRGFSSLELSIYVNRDVTDIDTNTVADYSLIAEPINNRVNFEIAELIRSKNDYLYEDDFYTVRDTATYVLLRAVLLDSDGDEIQVKYNFFKVRDGYLDRNEVQLLDSEINPDPRTWSDNVNVDIFTNQETPFGGTDGYLVVDTVNDNAIVSENELQLTGVYTLSCFLKGIRNIEFGKDATTKITFNLLSNTLISASSGIIAYDFFKVGAWYKVSIVVNMTAGDGLRIAEATPAEAESIRVFNPTIIKGNLINFTPKEVLLQSNTTIFSHENVKPIYVLDRKESVAYTVTSLSGSTNIRSFFISNPLLNLYRVITPQQTDFFLIETSQSTFQKVLCETKYTPVKVSFINKFGVIQDLVFFKKRVDTFNTSQQDFKANILRNGTYLPHTGQKQIINKQASAKVKLNTGFYPEDFNEVFKQLQYSTNYWIDDEPAILTGSNFAFKTSVNDKLINYSFDFEYANPDINDIR